MNNTLKAISVFIIGVVALIASSYTRTFSAEFVQFPILIAFFFICGWLLSLFYKKLWPFPLLFLFPTIAILVYAFIINRNGLFHYLGEAIMIIPSFFIGFHFFKWSKKIQFFTAILLPAFYFFYISKINPELFHYNNTVRNKGINVISEKPIPNFQFNNPDSSILELSQYKGKVIMIDFYYNNCTPCRKKMPELVKIKKHYTENKDFVLLAVHRGGSESFSDFLAMLKNFPKDLTYAYDSLSKASKYLEISGYPLEVLIDKNGQIREQFIGYNDDVSLVYEKNTIKKINALLNEKN